MINITIRELQLDGDTAMKLIKLIKKEEPEIWEVLKGELTEALNLHNVVGLSEQLHECSHRKGKECIKPSSCSAFGCNKPM